MANHKNMLRIAWFVLFLSLSLRPAAADDKGDQESVSTDLPKNLLVCILPMGKYDAYQMDKAVKGIAYFYGFHVEVLKEAQLPDAAYYPPRKRYRAEKLLDYIDTIVLPKTSCKAIIGFTAVDISTTKDQFVDWGIFGLGSMNGTSAVVSTYRLGRKTKSKKAVAIRTIKVVNHELGHVLGLPHCPTERCMMNDAKGTIKTVDKETGLLCELCRKQLKDAYDITLPNIPSFDWEQVISDDPK